MRRIGPMAPAGEGVQSRRRWISLNRTRLTAWGARARTVRVNVWTPAEGSDYLQKRTGADDQHTALKLAELLGFLPLALEQAAAYIEEAGIGLHGYLTLWERHQTRLLEDRGLGDRERTVATIWEISFKRVERVSPGAVALLQLCAFMSPG